MKRIIGIILVIIFLFIYTFFIFPDKPSVDNANNQKKVDNNLKLISTEIKQVNGQLIDVREPSEYLESHADEAVNIPLGDILKSDFAKIDKTKPIYLICRSGRRAEEAKVFLEKSGFANIKNLGGLVDWSNQGNKVCSTDKPSCM